MSKTKILGFILLGLIAAGGYFLMEANAIYFSKGLEMNKLEQNKLIGKSLLWSFGVTGLLGFVTYLNIKRQAKGKDPI